MIVNGMNLTPQQYENYLIACKLLPPLRREKKLALKWLADHDYYINKVFLGEWANDEPRFLEYLAERQIKRSRIDEIDREIFQIEMTYKPVRVNETE